MNRVGWVLAATFALLLCLRQCYRPPVYNPAKPETLPPDLIIRPDELERVAVDVTHATVTVATPKEVKTYTGVRRAVVAIKKDGTVVVTAKTFGFCFEPGLGVVFAPKPSLALDLRLIFWRRLGISLGSGVYPQVTPYVALTYDLAGVHMPNTNVFLGAGLGKQVVGGVCVRF